MTKPQSPTTGALIERLRLHRTWRDSHGELNDAPNEAADALEALSRPSPIAGSDEDEAYEIGKRDGYEQAVQDIDLLTGGDGEYRYCTNHDPDRHCPDADTMKQRIAERFASPIAEPQDSDAARDELAQTKPPAGQSEGFYARLRALVAAQRYQEALDLMRTPVLAAIADKDGHHG